MNEQPQNNLKQNPCPICGFQEFTWGRSIAYNSSWLYFRPEGGWLGDGEKLSLRKCNQCKNVQFFADVEY